MMLGLCWPGEHGSTGSRSARAATLAPKVHHRFRFLDHPGPIPFAHRGGSAEAPENTWAAFSHAVELGYKYMETDVHATADGVVAVIHDPCLDRVSEGTGNVARLRWREVEAARLAGDEVVPRLDEVLAAWPTLRWNIDAKHDAVVGPLVEVLKRAGAIERVCVTSFSDRRTARLKAALGPRLCTSAGPRAIGAMRIASVWGASEGRRGAVAGGVAGGGGLGEGESGVAGGGGGGEGERRGRRWAQLLFGGAAAAQVPIDYKSVPVVDDRFLRFSHRIGVAVHVWTIDDRQTMERLLDKGVDGIMTDRPSLLREVLEARGQWY